MQQHTAHGVRSAPNAASLRHVPAALPLHRPHVQTAPDSADEAPVADLVHGHHRLTSTAAAHHDARQRLAEHAPPSTQHPHHTVVTRSQQRRATVRQRALRRASEACDGLG